MSNSEAGLDFPGEYRLDVEDFGPIVQASVDLRPLTVFIGPSNTGKSYLAILLYALHQCFGEGNNALYGRRIRYRPGVFGSMTSSLMEDDRDTHGILDSFRNWLSHRVDNRSQTQLPIGIDSDVESQAVQKGFEAAFRPELPGDVNEYIRSMFEQAEGFNRYPERAIGRCFGVDNMGPLLRRSSSGSCAKVKLSIPRETDPQETDLGMVRYELRLHGDGITCSANIGGNESLSSEIAIDDIDNAPYLSWPLARPRDADYDDLRFSLARMAEHIFESLLTPLYRYAYYLPADRTGVMHSHQVVVSTLVQSATTAGLRPSASIPILSGVLADFLSQLIEMSEEKDGLGSRSRNNIARVSEALAKRLEDDVLKGTVEMGDVGSGYPSFSYLPNGWSEELPLMRASSMVSELAPVVLYLRHLVRPNDILIIEEPESHLHPAMQVAFTRQLAALVQAGIRVIVTTHSEWLLQELANLVRASQLPEAERAGIAGGEVALDPSQVGAWLFKPDATEEGSTVSEVGLDESGLYPSDFEDVAVAMHNDWAEISSRLGEDG